MRGLSGRSQAQRSAKNERKRLRLKRGKCGMMKSIWKKYVNRESVSYIIFGVLTTAVDWVTYTILWRLGADYRVSTAVSWAAAVLYSHSRLQYGRGAQ